MAGKSGAGKVWRDLGVINAVTAARYFGRIGGAGQPATLRLLFELETPASIQLRKLPGDHATDRFISLGLQWRNGRQIALNSQGFAVRSDIVGTAADETRQRWRPGKYTVVISTSQWQEAPFALELLLFPLVQPSFRASGRGGLDARRRRFRSPIKATGRGSLLASLQPLERPICFAAGAGSLRAGLQIIPSTRTPPPLGLGHAWVLRRRLEPELLYVGSGDGRSWASVESDPNLGSYLATRLTIDDFRERPGQRVIFSDRSFDIYASYTELGVSALAVQEARSPDTPGVSFLKLSNNRYDRRLLVGLPIENDRMILVFLDETLAWNNDIVRDTDATDPSFFRLSATNRRRSFYHRRRVSLFSLDRLKCRRLIRLPDGLLRRLDTLLPPLDLDLAERPVRVPGPSPVLPRLRVLCPGWAAQGRLPTPADRVLGGDPADRTSGLLRSYGMTNLLAADSSMTSAAVYSFLANFDVISRQADYDPRSTAFVIASLPDRPDGLPPLSPWLQDGGYRLDGTAQAAYDISSSQLLRYGVWKGPLPADTATQVAANDPRWSLAAQGLELSGIERFYRGESPQLFLAYDWGQAAYCRDKLLALGLTSTDLSSEPALPDRLCKLNQGLPRALRGSGGLGGGGLLSIKVHNLRLRLNSQGRLDASDLNWCLRIRAAGRGGLGGRPSITPDLRTVRRLLSARLSGSGLLSRSRVNPPPNTLVARGSLGRPALYSRPASNTRQVKATGRGRLLMGLNVY